MINFVTVSLKPYRVGLVPSTFTPSFACHVRWNRSSNYAILTYFCAALLFRRAFAPVWWQQNTQKRRKKFRFFCADQCSDVRARDTTLLWIFSPRGFVTRILILWSENEVTERRLVHVVSSQMEIRRREFRCSGVDGRRRGETKNLARSVGLGLGNDSAFYHPKIWRTSTGGRGRGRRSICLRGRTAQEAGSAVEISSTSA